MPKATVLIPTFNHGALIAESIESVRAQTLGDWELFVVGDGVPEETCALMRALCAEDARIRFFDFKKGSRHGEEHRHAALKEARGEFVCYLSDDDLWLPRHLERMYATLREADFAHSLPLVMHQGGKIYIHPGHLAVTASKEALLGGVNFIPLSSAGHTMALYRRLPYGWRTTPTGTHSDLYMWQQILSQPCSAKFIPAVTFLNFPNMSRKEISLDARTAELHSWRLRLVEPGFAEELTAQAIDFLAERRTFTESDAQAACALLETARNEFENSRREHRRLAKVLQELENSYTMKLKRLVLRVPGTRLLIRMASGTSAAREAPPAAAALDRDRTAAAPSTAK